MIWGREGDGGRRRSKQVYGFRVCRVEIERKEGIIYRAKKKKKKEKIRVVSLKRNSFLRPVRKEAGWAGHSQQKFFFSFVSRDFLN